MQKKQFTLGNANTGSPGRIEKHTFKNMVVSVSSPPKDLYTLNRRQAKAHLSTKGTHLDRRASNETRFQHIRNAFGSTVCMCMFLSWCWFGEQFAFLEMFIPHSSCDLIAIWNCARRCFVLVDVESTTFVHVPCKKGNSLLGMLVPARRAESRKP